MWRSSSGATHSPLIHLWDRRLWLILGLALLAGALAYQAPASANIAVGWLGDRLFLPTSEGGGADAAGSFYGDELSPDAQSFRSRWTRQDATVQLPGVGMGGDLLLTLRAQGWPADVLDRSIKQPALALSANGVPIQQVQLKADWADYSFTIPARARGVGALTLTLHASDTFTHTTSYPDDTRPKGFRLEHIALSEVGGTLTWPAPLPLLALLLNAGLWLLALSALTHRQTLSFVLTIGLASGGAIGLVLARIWAAALLPWAALVPALALLWIYRTPLLRMGGRWLARYSQGSALNYGLVALVSVWLAYLVFFFVRTYAPLSVQIFRNTFPDSLLLGLLALGLLALVLVLGREGLPRLAQTIVGALASRRGAAWLLGIAGGIWLGYVASVLAALPYVGHADYADNAVVARNLLAGRGWVVDYVTQFYRLYPSVTHPQETWPLLQPVWILPFFALFGAQAWAAKIPNLIFIALLGLLIYQAGARLWDRRVGLAAALIVLTSHLFFKLLIYTTTDLAFVLFAFGAIWLLYRALAEPAPDASAADQPPFAQRRALLGSALLTGLMMLQKPGSGVLIAAGMGVWLLLQGQRARRLRPALAAGIMWGLIALLILSPYMVRNLVLFRTPFYSTESRDAWVQGYTNDWEIYKVYAPDANLSETGGLPDVRWILRWGFDRSIRKISDQISAVRDYLMPPWPSLPAPIGSALFGRPDKTPLLFGMGAWLTLLGVLGALRARPRLLSLLGLAFLPYSLFLIFYWHADEERYFVMVMPWLALLAAYALWRSYDRIAVGSGRWAPIGLALAATALALIIGPSWPIISEKVNAEPERYAADIDAYTWLAQQARANSEADAVVMTRTPWQFNWQSQLPALMVPHTTEAQTFLRIARYYHVRYLVLDSLQRPPAEIRQMLDTLTKPKGALLTLVYATKPYPTFDSKGKPITMVTEIYRFPDNYGGAAELNP